MEENKVATQIFFCGLFTALVLLSCPAPVGGQKGDFNYDPQSDKGPNHWGDIQPNWYKCKNGTMQSPINLSETSEILHSKLQVNYGNRGIPTELANLGHGIALLWVTNRLFFITIDQTKYYLQGYYWHSPSEHTINGKRYALELQMVYGNKANRQYAAVAVLYKIGRPDAFLSQVVSRLRPISHKSFASIHFGLEIPLNREIGLSSSSYFRYNGSFTIPPCSEVFVWTVLTQIKTVSEAQVFYLRTAVGNKSYTNARPLQPINKRPVKLYTQE